MLEAKTAELEQIGTLQWTDSEVERYLRTGEYDGFFVGWPGSNLPDIATRASQRLRSALVTDTMRRSRGFESVSRLPVDLHTWNSEKLKPMVDGLFNPSERATVIRLLSDNVVFVTRANLEKILMAERWLSTAWDVVNIFLESVKAPTLSGQPCNIVGLSQETRYYVSMDYFDETDPFADFVVHEAAHVFHNSRRVACGLAASARTDYILDIDYRMRETFAYACEAWSRISSAAQCRCDRKALILQHADRGLPSE
ncbi:hypothetical protein [Caballeronia sordidicola]|uniref:hypothetical protein n=1 Tax=Caballeronia sordidicola TaxID=196367 RepID=UPI00117DF444|nr:hypothetical protein [Caballeronia sordidicola]